MPRNARDENTVIQAPNNMFIDAAQFTANASAVVTISSVAPAAVGTATISKWLRITDSSGVDYFIPCWT